MGSIAMIKMRDLLRGTYHTMTRFHDQREFELAKVNTAITLYYGHPDKVCETLCVNISKNGMGIMIDQVIPMELNAKLRFMMAKPIKMNFKPWLKLSEFFDLEEGQFSSGLRYSLNISF